MPPSEARVGGFELDGAEGAEDGVASSRVVPRFNPFEDGLGELVAVVPAPTVQELGLQAGEEGSGNRVVQGVADRTQAAEEARLPEPLAERAGGAWGGFDRWSQGLES